MRALVVGTLTFDIIGTTAGALPDHSLTVPLDSLTRSPGGRGANSSVVLASMGCHVRLVSCVGPDFTDSRYLAELRDRGIDEAGLFWCGDSPTPTVFIFTNQADSRVYQFRDRTPEVASGFTRWAAEQASTWPHDAVYCTSEIPSANAAALRSSAAVLKVFAPGHDLLAYETGELNACLDLADVTIVNWPESQTLSRLLGRPLPELYGGGRTLVVTRGEHGSIVHTASGSVDVPAWRTELVRDTTGAGDAYAAGLVYGALTGLDVIRAARTASAMASFVIESHGCQTSVPTPAELSRRTAGNHPNPVRRDRP